MSMHQLLKERVPLFGMHAPWAVRTSFVIFVLVWFQELNDSLHILSLTKFIHQTQQMHIGLIVICVMWGGWQLFNVLVLTGIAYRGNWARLIQLTITLFGTLFLLTTQMLNHRFNIGLFYLANAAATALLFVPSATTWFSKSTVQRDRGVHY
jgi:hypothetical protein